MKVLNGLVLALMIGFCGALDPSCLLPDGEIPTIDDVVRGPTPPGPSWSCAVLRAVEGTARFVQFEVDSATLSLFPLSEAQLQVVFWNVQANPQDPVFASTNSIASGRIFGVLQSLTQMPRRQTPWNIDITPQSFTDFWGVRPSGPESQTLVAVAVSLQAKAGYYAALVNAIGGQSSRPLGLNVTAGVLWRVVGESTNNRLAHMNMSSSATEYDDELFPVQSSMFSTLRFNVPDQEWALRRYMLKSMQVQITGPADFFPGSNRQFSASVAAKGNDGATWGLSASSFTQSVSPSGIMALDASWRGNVAYIAGGSAPTAEGAVLTLTMNQPQILTGPANYNWGTIGPFVKITGRFVATTWPRLQFDGTSTNVSVAYSSNIVPQQAVFMLETTDSLDYDVGVTLSNICVWSPYTIPSAAGCDAVCNVTASVLAIASFVASSTVSQYTPPRVATTIRTNPSHLAQFYVSGNLADSEPGSGSALFSNLPVQWAGASGMAHSVLYFVELSPSGNVASGLIINATVTATKSNARIECDSHADCMVPHSVHPARARATALSANGDAARFSSCYLIGNQTGPGTAQLSTRCMECAPVPSSGSGFDLECGDGQFCWTDDGTCSSGGGSFLCDEEAQSRLGVCRRKSSNVLGKQCHTIGTSQVAQPQPANTPHGGDANSTPAAIGATFTGSQSVNGFAPGGFCGEVRLYNSSGLGNTFGAFPNSQFNPNGTARTALWTGTCFNGLCSECAPSSTALDSGIGTTGKTCVNGRYVSAITIDSTIRTFGVNPEVITTIVIAAIVLIMLTTSLCSMQNASNRHRELFGQAPLGFCDELRAVTYQWMCCAKRRTSRAARAPYAAPGTPRDLPHNKLNRIAAPTEGTSLENPLRAVPDWTLDS